MQNLLKAINKPQIDNPDVDKEAKHKYSEQYQNYWLKVTLNTHHQIKVAALKASVAD
ncbi:hypothetical protein H4J58_08760 [Colwellia sp. MB3u-70]|uniref:hypothetical protein n=1 Tax=unclassified Colwellia TaxID=196834 RepID=UPI0015F35E08|nr:MULTISPECIES: hypothetical protein [unclassified Colwellia]MBA6291382.1 hypothetical protein [Colwellia sp. MB3u-8]MBA6307202.1 hypothetical protein [Colwellia sp. MB3u-70]